jgi:hypothetical protein
VETMIKIKQIISHHSNASRRQFSIILSDINYKKLVERDLGSARMPSSDYVGRWGVGKFQIIMNSKKRDFIKYGKTIT